MGHARTLWEEGHHAGWRVVAVASAALLAVAGAHAAGGWQPHHLFGAAFVLAALAQALLVRPGDFWSVVFAPPAQMLGICLLLIAVAPGSLSGDAHRAQAFFTGLAGLATPLAAGCVLAWGALWIRLRVQERRAGAVGVQSSNRDGSPAPTRTTSG